MRSGLYTYDDDPEFWAILERDPTKVWSPAEVLAIAFKHPPYFPPGTGFTTPTPTTRCSASLQKRSTGSRWRVVSRTVCSDRSGLKDTLLPATDSNTLPDPYSHGYLYGGCSFSNLTDKPYPSRPPGRGQGRNPQARRLHRPELFLRLGGRGASSRPPTISPHGSRHWSAVKVLNADYQRQWLDSLQPEVRSKPEGQKYGYGISQISWGPNTIYFHGGEMPGFNSKISYDPTNKLTLIIWTNLTVSLDGQQTANTLFVKMLDQIYVVVRRCRAQPSPINLAKPVGPRAPFSSRRFSRTNYLFIKPVPAAALIHPASGRCWKGQRDKRKNIRKLISKQGHLCPEHLLVFSLSGEPECHECLHQVRFSQTPGDDSIIAFSTRCFLPVP
jgi:hypothetical protein